MAARLCLAPGCRELGNPRCPEHQAARRPAPRQRSQANRERDAWRGSRQSRGYGATHDRAARALKAQLVDGEPCGCGCGRPMARAQLALGPTDPGGIDAGHHPARPASDGWPPERLEHRACNVRAAGATLGRRTRG